MKLFKKPLVLGSTLALSFSTLHSQRFALARLGDPLPAPPPSRGSTLRASTPRIAQHHTAQHNRHALTEDNQHDISVDLATLDLATLSTSPSSPPSEPEETSADENKNDEKFDPLVFLACLGGTAGLYILLRAHQLRRESLRRMESLTAARHEQQQTTRDLRRALELSQQIEQNAPRPARPNIQLLAWEHLPFTEKTENLQSDCVCPISFDSYEDIAHPVEIRINETEKTHTIFDYEQLKRWIEHFCSINDDGKVNHPSTQIPFDPTWHIFRLTPYHELNNNDNKRDEPPSTIDTPAFTNPETNADIVEPTHTEQASEMSQV